jgi:PAS domain S-box-containing protein
MNHVQAGHRLETVKDQIINTTLVVASIFGTIAYLLSFLNRFTTGNFNISIAFETVILLFSLITAIRRNYLSIRFKAYTMLILVLVLSFSDAYIYGLLSATRIYLILIPLFALIYFSFLKTLIFLMVTIAGFIAIGYLHYSGVLQIPEGYEPAYYYSRFYPWIIIAVHITVVGMVILFVLRKFFNSFSELVLDLQKQNSIVSGSERNYREIFNSTNEAVFIHNNNDGKIVDVNDVMLRMFGYSNKDEVLALSVADLSDGFDPDIQKKANNMIQKAVTDAPHIFEWKSKCKNGDLFFSEISLKSTNIGGEGRVLAVVRDISIRKKAEEELRKSQERLSTVFRLTPVAIAIADTEDQNRITDVNNAFLNITGYTVDELIGKTYQEERFWAYPEEYQKAVKIFRENGKLYDFEFHFRRKDGEIRMGRISTESAEIAGRRCLVTATVDITQQKQTESDLIAAREASELNSANFKAIIENNTNTIWALDPNYEIIYTNKVFHENYQRSFGISLSPGVNLLDSIPDPLRPIWKARYDRALNNNQFIFEDAIDTMNGTIHIQVSMNPIFADGKVIGVSCFGSDITTRKKAEEALRQSEEKFRIIFENSPLGIFRFDKEGTITECNFPLIHLIGSSKEKVLGLNLFNLPDARLRAACKDVINGKPAYFEGLYKSFTSDKKTPVRFFFAPVINQHGVTEGGICLTEDRTFLTQKEEYRKQAEVAKESVKFKQNFLANMSHEIRTPLTGILGMIEILEHTNLSENQQDYINTLKLSGENLREIINQVLDYSKIEAGKVNLKYSTFDFKSLINGAELLFQNIAKKGVQFCSDIDKDIPELIVADKNRISQIINNLVSNALKFTDKGSVVINARVVSHNPNDDQITIKIEVKDTGIGIPSELKHNLFVPFSQIDDNDKRFREGTGLGLTICKELVTLHGGDIGVESEYTKGSNFWFTFITRIPDAADKIQNNLIKTEKPPITGLRILFAEDKEINQKVVGILLRSMGHELIIANDGKQAISLYEPGKFDLILMDIQMPVMDGITATQTLKKKFKTLPPIIGLSANAFEGDREKYMSQGMDDYLTKPVKRDDFIHLIARLFPE